MNVIVVGRVNFVGQCLKEKSKLALSLSIKKKNETIVGTRKSASPKKWRCQLALRGMEVSSVFGAKPTLVGYLLIQKQYSSLSLPK